MRVATGCCGCRVFLLPAVVLEFDGIGEIGEGSTEVRHGETAEDSGVLAEGFCATRRCELPKTLIFVQGPFLPAVVAQELERRRTLSSLIVVNHPSFTRDARGRCSSSLIVVATVLFGVATVPAVTVSEMARIACSPVSAVGCGLIFP